MHTRKEELSALEMLTARSDFVTVQSKGRKWISHGVILQVRPNDLGHIRIGYTVSKKVDKSAVVRNRVKRRLRAVAAHVFTNFAKDGHDYILVGRKETRMRDFDVLIKDLKWCLGKMGYFEEKNKTGDQ